MSIVRLENLRKRFGAVEVLKGVSLAVTKGSVVVVIGRSGSGKSTLLRCVNGLETPDEGHVDVDGERVTEDEAALRRLRQRVGFVFQSFNLFPHLTAEGNVSLGLTVVKKVSREEARERSARALEKVGLLDRRHAYPDQLSGGQQQRVAIARCLALSPTVLLFDEVTSALDPELKGEVLKVIEDLARDGMTMLLVTHEMQFARRVAHQVVFMHDGQILEQGPPAELFAEPRTAELRRFIGTSL